MSFLVCRKLGAPCSSELDGFAENVECEGHFGGRHIQRRNKSHNGKGGRCEQKHSLMQAHLGHFCRKCVGQTLVKLHSNHQAQTAHIANQIGELTLQLEKTFAQFRRSRIHVVENSVALQNVERRAGSRARDGVTGKRSSHRSGGLLLHQIVGRCDSRENVAIGYAFCKDENVRDNVFVLHGKVLASAAKAGLNLISNEQDVVLGAQLAQLGQIAFGSGHIASFSQHWLQDDCGSVAGRRLLLENQLDLLERIVAASSASVAPSHTVEAKGKGSNIDSGNKWAESGAVNRFAGRHSHCGKSAAVIRPLQHDNVLLASRVASQLPRSLDCVRTSVPKEDTIEPLKSINVSQSLTADRANYLGHDLGEARHQIELLLMKRNVDLRVRDFPCLFAHSVDHVRLRVTENAGADAGGKVKQHLVLLRGGEKERKRSMTNYSPGP